MPERKLKVVHLITRLELGGAQGNTIHTVEHLDPARFDAHLWFGPGGYWDSEVEKKFPSDRRKSFPHLVRSIHPLFDFLVIRELAESLRRETPDVLHTHSSKAGIVGRIAARLAGVPILVHTFHGFGFNKEQKPWTRALFIFLERLTARWTHALVFVSQANWDEAKSLRFGKVDRYHRIRSGIPLKSFQHVREGANRAMIREKLKLGSDPVLLTVGPFKPQKNLVDLVSATVRIKQRHPKLKVLIVGDGEQRPFLEKMISDLKLSDTIQLLGWRRDIPALMAVADIFVMTSLWEGLPRSLAEALAAGLPAVCYDADGVRDLLSKGGGFLIPSKDLKAFVEKVDSLFINKELARALSSQGPALVQNEFDIDQMVRDQEALYEQLVSNR